jgi:DNA-binding response OmpR family regulator
MSKRAIAYVSDLMFSSNIQETLGRAGYEVAVADDMPSLERELNLGLADVVLLDLHAGAPAGAIFMLCQPYGIPVVAFGRHTEPVLLREARDAGCAAAVPRSTFVEEMVELVEKATGA